MLRENLKETSPEKQKQLVADYFSETVRFWNDLYSNDSLRGLYSYAMIKRKEITMDVIDRYSDNRILQVLDVGCGPGIVMEAIASRGHKIVGIDISENMLKEARQKMLAYTCKENVCFQGDIEDLPFDNQSFDAIISLAVLQYLPDDHRSLLEMSRVIKKEGVIIICLPNRLKLRLFFDPISIYRFLQMLYSFIFHRKDRKSAKTINRDSITSTARTYLPWHLQSLFKAYNFERLALYGIDYGPLTFFEKPLLSDHVSLKINNLLNSLSELKIFSWIKIFANQWVIVLQKNY